MSSYEPSQKDAPPVSRPRPSLKEIAARASQSGVRPAGRGSSGPLSTPLPSVRGAISTPIPQVSAPISVRESGDDDSGIVDLNMIRAMATPQQKAAAEKAQPASAGLFDDDEKPSQRSEHAPGASRRDAPSATPLPSTNVPAPKHSGVRAREAAQPQPAKRRSSGALSGIVIAAIGFAAAAGIVVWKKHLWPRPAPIAAETPAQPPVMEQAPPPPQAQPPVAAGPADQAQPVPQAAELAPDPTKVAANDAAKAGHAIAAAPRAAGAAPPGAAPAPAPADKPTAAPAAAPEAPPAKTGDLASAMRQEVGADKAGSQAAGASPEPASAGGKGANQTVPEQPSQGSVQAAIGSVMPAAKACVAEADDVTRAQITFGSNGSVTSVSVSGWAAQNGQAGCVKNALKGASVGPFARPTFTFGVTIRP